MKPGPIMMHKTLCPLIAPKGWQYGGFDEGRYLFQTGNYRGESKTFRVAEYDGAEFIKPWGSYSMAPIINANDGK